MRAAGPVLLLVALAGCQSVFSASLEVASKEDASDERGETEAEAGSEGTARNTETMSTKVEKTEAMKEESSDEAEERYDVELLKRIAGNGGSYRL
ncbi:hypothetical protein QTP70_001234 [Hemibagrus guttatus]|uniref:Secreted protein n=1 Tax=Hemibagrus guttatus TaxID=175788 RepID=A0AAE0UX53_9TELE|nr:hypothetical protein QTP70_001234 [Hemibagrus guttatus]